MYFVSKIVFTYCEEKCSSDIKTNLTFKVEGREFKNIYVHNAIYDHVCLLHVLCTNCYSSMPYLDTTHWELCNGPE